MLYQRYLIYYEAFKNERSIKIIPVETNTVNMSLDEFNQIMAEIENSIICEVNGNGIKFSWNPYSGKRTCDVLTLKHSVKKSETTKNLLTTP